MKEFFFFLPFPFKNIVELLLFPLINLNMSTAKRTRQRRQVDVSPFCILT